MLACRVTGSPDATPLLLTHGVTDSAASLADAAARFSTDWLVISIDTLGHGDSPRFTNDDVARPLEAAVEALRDTVVPYVTERGPAAALGHSMGGALLSRLAYESPTLLAGIVLEDPAWLTAGQAAQYRKHAAIDAARWEADRDDRAVLSQTLRDYPRWPPSELIPWLRAKDTVDKRFLRQGTVGYVEPWNDWLGSLTVPTVVLTSDQPDCIIGPDGLAKIDFLANPMIETVMVAGLRHVMRRHDPGRFYSVVEPILSRWQDLP